MRRGRISDVEPGDVIGFAGCDWLSCAIQVCTLGLPGVSLSHVGIAVEWVGFRRPLLCEATTQCAAPCAVLQRRLDGVQCQHLRGRVLRYPGRVYHYPLAKRLNWVEAFNLYHCCADHLGKSYDAFGALAARDTLYAALHRAPEDLVSFFCSELVAVGLRSTGRFPVINASSLSPNRLTRHLVRRGIVHKPVRLK